MIRKFAAYYLVAVILIGSGVFIERFKPAPNPWLKAHWLQFK